MAAIEFVGYSIQERVSLKRKMLPILKQLDFFNHIVWTNEIESEIVTNLEEKEFFFVRFYTRSAERGSILMEKFSDLFVVEIVYIAMSVIHGNIFQFPRQKND